MENCYQILVTQISFVKVLFSYTKSSCQHFRRLQLQLSALVLQVLNVTGTSGLKIVLKVDTGHFVCLLGFNVRATIFQLYADDEHEMMK